MNQKQKDSLIEKVSTHVGYLAAAMGVIGLAAALARAKEAVVPGVPLLAEVLAFLVVLASLVWIGYIGLKALEYELRKDETSWLSGCVIAASIPITLFMGKATFFVSLGL